MRPLCVLLSCALLALAAAPAAPAAPASSGASATAEAAAKKKCKKRGYVRRGRRCVKRTKPGPVIPRPPEPDDPKPPQMTEAEKAARFTELLAGSSLYRVYANTTSTGSSQGNDRYSFCSGGGLSYYGEYIGYTGNSYVTRWGGTWKVDKAAFSPDGNVAEGDVSYTANSSEVPPSGVVRITLGGSQAVMTDSDGSQREFQWQRGNAGC